MTIAVTGATGQFGRHAVEALLDAGAPAGDIVATGRRTETLTNLAERGVRVRRGDYDDEASMREAFTAVDRVLLVSGSDVDRRAGQHATVIAAAQAAGVEFIAYTSITRADTSRLMLAASHLATEQALAASGIPFALLRNSWYLENYTTQLPTYLQHGITGAARDGRVSAAARGDYAEAAAAVMATEGHAGAVYELGGAPFTMIELAEAVSSLTGHHVSYTDLPVEQYQAILVAAGLPETLAAVYADGDRGIADGELLVDGADLEKLLGRPPVSLLDTLAAARPPS